MSQFVQNADNLVFRVFQLLLNEGELNTTIQVLDVECWGGQFANNRIAQLKVYR